MGTHGEGLPTHAVREIMFLQECQINTISNLDIDNDNHLSFNLPPLATYTSCPSYIPEIYDIWYVKGRLHMAMNYANKNDIQQYLLDLLICLNTVRKNISIPNNSTSSTHLSSEVTTLPGWVQIIQSLINKVWNTSTIITILRSIAQSLQYIHTQHNIFHRDLKPGNILLSSASPSRIHTILCDWGMSSFIPSSSDILNYNVVSASAADAILDERKQQNDMTSSSTSKNIDNEQSNNNLDNDLYPEEKLPLSRWEGGMFPQVVTPHYRPPELLYGSHSYTESVDTWGFGCILAEIVRGYIFSQRWYDTSLPAIYTEHAQTTTYRASGSRSKRFRSLSSDEENEYTNRAVFRRMNDWDSDDDDTNQQPTNQLNWDSSDNDDHFISKPTLSKGNMFDSDTKSTPHNNSNDFAFPDDNDDQLLLRSTKQGTSLFSDSKLDNLSIPNTDSISKKTSTSTLFSGSSIGKPILFRQLTSSFDDNSTEANNTTNNEVQTNQPQNYVVSSSDDAKTNDLVHKKHNEKLSMTSQTQNSSHSSALLTSSLSEPVVSILPLKEWKPLYYNEGGDLALLATIIRNLGSVDSCLWSDSVTLPGYMPGELLCPYCTPDYLKLIQGHPIYGSCYTTYPVRQNWQTDMPWLLDTTVNQSCAVYSSSPNNLSIIKYHLIGAYNLYRWLGMEGISLSLLTNSSSSSSLSSSSFTNIPLIIDLLLECFIYNPSQRITITNILQHPLFTSNREI